MHSLRSARKSLLQVETIQHRLEENASGMTGKVTDLEKNDPYEGK